VGAAAVSALTNSRFQYVNFGTPGGQFLLAVNGADAMRRYDGSAWTDATAAPAVTGFNTTLAISINTWGQRIWMVEKNSFRVWYLPLQSIGGAATALDLSSLFRLGGSLAGMLTWTVPSTINHAAIRGVRLDRRRGSNLRRLRSCQRVNMGLGGHGANWPANRRALLDALRLRGCADYGRWLRALVESADARSLK
jgi:hypothetical protein